MNQSKETIYRRQKDLLTYIKENRSVRVSDAADYLDVSEITVRRDLMELERQRQVVRFHGGARINAELPDYDVSFADKDVKNQEAKDAIGKEAAHLVAENSTVFLNSGTTTLAALRYLDNKRIRIITNNALAPTAIRHEKTELILTGGECRCRSKSLIGSQAVGMISHIYADFCILGVNGISAGRGITTSILHETSINDMMVQRCNGSVIVVADGSKIGRTYDFVSIDTRSIDILITDSSADKAELDKIRQEGVKVITINVG